MPKGAESQISQVGPEPYSEQLDYSVDIISMHKLSTGRDFSLFPWRHCQDLPCISLFFFFFFLYCSKESLNFDFCSESIVNILLGSQETTDPISPLIEFFFSQANCDSQARSHPRSNSRRNEGDAEMRWQTMPGYLLKVNTARLHWLSRITEGVGRGRGKK